MVKKSKKGMKKSFYEVVAPITATKIQLYASSPEDLNNKTVKIDLSKNLKGKSLILKIRIKEDKGKLEGNPESLELAISYIKRVMRRGTDYAEDSFETESRDKMVTIKPLMITRRRVSRAVLKALRETAKKNIQSYAKTRNSEELISDIITNKLQKTILPKLKKIYPLALCEIRAFKIGAPLKKEKTSEKEISSE